MFKVGKPSTPRWKSASVVLRSVRGELYHLLTNRTTVAEETTYQNFSNSGCCFRELLQILGWFRRAFLFVSATTQILGRFTKHSRYINLGQPARNE